MDVANLLCDALESGSNYWYRITGKEKPETFNSFSDGGNEKDGYSLHTYPFNKNGAILIDDGNSVKPVLRNPVILNEHRIMDGLTIMAKKYSGHFGDFLSGDYDETTSDVFLQCCVFGECIYG